MKGGKWEGGGVEKCIERGRRHKRKEGEKEICKERKRENGRWMY